MLPLLNLPLVPFEQIIKNMELIEIFHISMLSKQCATAVEYARVKVDEVRWVLDGFNRRIVIETPSDRIGISFDVEKSQLQETPINQQFAVRKNLLTKPFVYTSKPTKCLLEHLSVHIRKVFKAKEQFLTAIYVSPCLPTFWDKLNLHFKKVLVRKDENKDDCSESLEFLLDNCKVEEFILELRVASEFQYSKPLKYRDLTVYGAEWFTKENLLNMDCEKLRIEGSNINTSDLNVFFEKWKEGGFPKLKKFHIFWPLESRWDLRIEETDEKGRPILTDVNGNRGTFLVNQGSFIEFEVNVQDN